MGETPDNIRHLDARAEDATGVLLPAAISDLALQFMRNSQDKPVGRRGRLSSSSKKEKRMDALEDEVLRIKEDYGIADLVSGFNELRALLPNVSKVSQPHAVRVRACLEENLSWFAAHLGLAATAYRHAKSAMEYRRICYNNSFGTRAHLLAYASSGLNASNSLLISYRPKEPKLPQVMISVQSGSGNLQPHCCSMEVTIHLLASSTTKRAVRCKK
jgi:hypothetical protein